MRFLFSIGSIDFNNNAIVFLLLPKLLVIIISCRFCLSIRIPYTIYFQSFPIKRLLHKFRMIEDIRDGMNEKAIRARLLPLQLSLIWHLIRKLNSHLQRTNTPFWCHEWYFIVAKRKTDLQTMYAINWYLSLAHVNYWRQFRIMRRETETQIHFLKSSTMKIIEYTF